MKLTKVENGKIALLISFLFFGCDVLFGQNQPKVDAALNELTRLGEITPPSFSNEPFLDAVERGDLTVAKLFLQVGIDVNANDSWKRNPLITAVEKGNLEMVKLLVGEGADISIRDKHRRTVFIVAANGDHTDILHYLQISQELQSKL